MTTETAARPTRPARGSVRLDPTLRALRCEIARWALAEGRPLNLDAITVILAARHREALAEGRSFNRWTTNSVLTFLFGTADVWCDDQGVAHPPHLGESLFTYVEFLHASGVLSADSSRIVALRSTIADLAGLSTDGHRRPSTTEVAAQEPLPFPDRARRRPDACG